MNKIQESDIIEQYYSFHSNIYDYTRWTFLFGRRALAEKVMAHLKPESHLAELGCGTGHNLRLFEQREDLKLTGLDLSEQMIQQADKKLQRSELLIRKYDIDAFPPESFDAIFLSYFVTLNSNQEGILKAVKHHLKKGGHLAIVDFHRANLELYNRFMLRNHIHINPNLLSLAEDNFQTEYKKVGKAYFGVWNWMMFLGKKL